jgi:hypothetical protein
MASETAPFALSKDAGLPLILGVSGNRVTAALESGARLEVL